MGNAENEENDMTNNLNPPHAHYSRVVYTVNTICILYTFQLEQV